MVKSIFVFEFVFAVSETGVVTASFVSGEIINSATEILSPSITRYSCVVFLSFTLIRPLRMNL